MEHSTWQSNSFLSRLKGWGWSASLSSSGRAYSIVGSMFAFLDTQDGKGQRNLWRKGWRSGLWNLLCGCFAAPSGALQLQSWRCCRFEAMVPLGLQGVMEPSRTCWWHLVFLAESSYVWPFGLLHDISDKNFGLNRGYCYMLNAPFILQRAGPMLYLSSWKQTLHVGRWGESVPTSSLCFLQLVFLPEQVRAGFRVKFRSVCICW